MIFVTLGTEQFDFSRALSWIDRAIDETQAIDRNDLVVQHGSTSFRIKGAINSSVLNEDSFNDCIERASLIIAHCGEGTFLHLNQGQTPYLLIPRRYSEREHVDDHQCELGEALAQLAVPIAWQYNDVIRFIGRPQVFCGHKYVSDYRQVASFLNRRFYGGD